MLYRNSKRFTRCYKIVGNDGEIIEQRGGFLNIEKWILCPVCGGKTRNKIREDTVLINYPLYCPKCRKESLIEAKNMQISIVREPNIHTYKAVNY